MDTNKLTPMEMLKYVIDEINEIPNSKTTSSYSYDVISKAEIFLRDYNKEETLVYVNEDSQTLLSNTPLKFFWSECCFDPENYDALDDFKHFYKLFDSKVSDKTEIEKTISLETESYQREYEEYLINKIIQNKKEIISNSINNLKDKVEVCSACEQAIINEHKIYCIKHNKNLLEVDSCNGG